MPSALLLAILSSAGAAQYSPATEWVNAGVRFARIDPAALGTDQRRYRVTLVDGGQESGILAVTCDKMELAGATFEPGRPAAEGGSPTPDWRKVTEAIIRASDNRLCG